MLHKWLLLLLRPTTRAGTGFLARPNSLIRSTSSMPSSCSSAGSETREFVSSPKGRERVTLTNQVVGSSLLNCSSDLIALSLFIWSSRKPDYFHDRQAFDIMVGVVGRLTVKYRTVNAIVKELECIGLATKAGTFLLLLRVYWHGGMYRMVLETFDEMGRFGFKPNTFAYNVMMDISFRIGDKDAGMKVLGAVSFPNFLSYNVALCHVCKSNDLVLIRDVLSRMVRKGFYPSSQTFEMVMNCFCRAGNLAGAFQVLGLMITLGNPPSAKIWTMLIDGYFRLGEPGMAGIMLNKMIETGFSPCIVTYTILFKGYMESDMVDKAFSILNAMESEGFARDLIFCNVFIHSLIKLGRDDDDNAQFLFANVLKWKLVPDSFTICSLLSARGCSRVSILRLKLVSRFVVLDNRVLYNSLIHFCCDAGYPFLAQWFYHDMIEKGFIPDNYSFVGLLRGLFAQGRSDEAVNVYRGLLINRSDLDAHVHTVVIDSLLQCGSVDKAMDLFRKAMVRNYPLDVVSYTVAIRGLLENGRQEEALDLYDHMKNGHLTPSVHTYRAMLRGLRLRRDPKTASRVRKLMDDILQAGVQLDYHSLVRLTVFFSEHFDVSTPSLGHLKHLWSMVGKPGQAIRPPPSLDKSPDAAIVGSLSSLPCYSEDSLLEDSYCFADLFDLAESVG